jgi:hypothetical protein
MRIDPDWLREYGRECDGSASEVSLSRGELDGASWITPSEWGGGVLVDLLQLQNALDDMRDTYDHVRHRMLDRVSLVADDLRQTDETLRMLADEAERDDQIAKERLENLWP